VRSTSDATLSVPNGLRCRSVVPGGDEGASPRRSRRPSWRHRPAPGCFLLRPTSSAAVLLCFAHPTARPLAFPPGSLHAVPTRRIAKLEASALSAIAPSDCARAAALPHAAETVMRTIFLPSWLGHWSAVPGSAFSALWHTLHTGHRPFDRVASFSQLGACCCCSLFDDAGGLRCLTSAVGLSVLHERPCP
jgi:hypothetical protein